MHLMRRFRAATLWAFGPGIAALVVYDIGLRSGERMRPAAAKVVSAQEFQVLGADGKVRARLTTAANDRPSLVLYDNDSTTPRALVGMTVAGDPIFTFLDRDGKTPRLIADLTASSTPTSLAKTTRSGLHIYDGSGKAVWAAP
jgi:hypothetical protein